MKTEDICWENCYKNGKIWELAVRQTIIDVWGNNSVQSPPQNKNRFCDWDWRVTINGLIDDIECKCEEDWPINICLEWWRTILEKQYMIFNGKKIETNPKKIHEPNGLQLSKADLGIHALEKARVVVVYDMKIMQQILALLSSGKLITPLAPIFRCQDVFKRSDKSTGGYLANFRMLMQLQPKEIEPYGIILKDEWITQRTVEDLPKCRLFKGNQK